MTRLRFGWTRLSAGPVSHDCPWGSRVNKAFLCQVCSADRLELIDSYARIPRVTSDCKPWPAGGKMAVCGDCGAVQKLPDAVWLDEIGRIYRDYQIYDLSNGAEQVIFNSAGSAAPRSRTLVDFLLRAILPPPTGKLIDIGCGNGAALGTFSSAPTLSRWSLYGSELSASALPALKALSNFVELFTGDLEDIKERFDIVTMIHSLEHMPMPARSLEQALGLLAAGGTLFVEVPDAETSPFDLIVADHLMHFSRATLHYLAGRVGCSARILRNDVLPKEITFVAQPGTPSSQKPDAAQGADIARATVNWLQRVINAADDAAARGGPFGIFGTSISAMWLYGARQGQVAFFVDEDRTRIGRNIDGRPIVAPADIPAGATVFVPLVPAVAERVIARLSPLKAQFVAPPALV